MAKSAPRFSPYTTVVNFYYDAIRSGLWEKIRGVLMERVRTRAGRNTGPSYAIIDSQSIKTASFAEEQDNGAKTCLAWMEYLNSTLTAGGFLRWIDTTHELEGYEVDKAELEEETAWQRMVAGDFGFDAETHYPKMMQGLDSGAEDPKWELRTADELRREDLRGHQNFLDKYGKR